MRYTMTITADHDMEEDEVLTLLDPLGDTYNSATVGKRRVHVDGVGSSAVAVILMANKVRRPGVGVLTIQAE